MKDEKVRAELIKKLKKFFSKDEKDFKIKELKQIISKHKK
tara:strand:+ start:2728 stop:2847 length:120 start_codon:yes stop_codon:yes gene_type:complete